MCSPNGTSTQAPFRKPINQTTNSSETDVSEKSLIENNPQDYLQNTPTNFRDLNSSTRFLADDGLNNGQIVGQTHTFNDPLSKFFDSTKNNLKGKTGDFVRDTAINAAKFGGKTLGTTGGLVLAPQSDEEFLLGGLGLLGGGIGGGALGTLLPVPGGFATGATIGGGIGSNIGANFGKQLSQSK